MSRAIQQQPQPAQIRTLALVVREYREIDFVINDIATRMAENKRIIVEAEEGMTRPLQKLSEIHRLAAVKQAYEISLAADEPVVKKLGWKRLSLESEIDRIRGDVGIIAQRIKELEVDRHQGFAERIARIEEQLALVKGERKRSFDDPIEELHERAKKLIGE